MFICSMYSVNRYLYVYIVTLSWRSTIGVNADFLRLKMYLLVTSLIIVYLIEQDDLVLSILLIKLRCVKNWKTSVIHSYTELFDLILSYWTTSKISET